MDVLAALLPPVVVAAAFIAIGFAIKKRMDADSQEEKRGNNGNSGR